jgi:RNA polymerase sigma-70 factor (ECF subfamily)
MTALMEPQETEALVRRAQHGDREAFDELVNVHARRLEALVHSRMGAHLKRVYEVDDVVQEVLVRSFAAMDRFRWEGDGSFMRWLGSIAEHVILKLAGRYEREHKLSILGDPPGTRVSPSRSLRREERFERLRQAVSALSPDHREVMLLARVEGLRIKEIARRMSRSPEATKQLLSRALQALRKSFGDTESLHLPPRSLKDEGAHHDAQ